jgi:hypothetical protein
MPGWHTAFALQQTSLSPHAPGSAVRIAFDPARKADTKWGMSIPVRVTGIPAGMALNVDRAQITLESAAGYRESDWDEVRAGNTAELLPGDGDYFLNLSASPSGSLARLRLALTLLDTERLTPLPIRSGTQAVPGGGVCWTMHARSTINAACGWPARAPALVTIMGMTGTGSYGPYPASSGLWQWVVRAWAVPPADGIELVTRQALAHFERDVDIPGGGQLR